MTPKQTPSEPGFYWFTEGGKQPHIIEVIVESDSHRMFLVRLPDDDHKYPFDLWPGARWFGRSKRRRDPGLLVSNSCNPP
jgi:hypothetical protein